MKAIVRSRYGGPSTLSYKTVAKPVPKKNEVLVALKVSAFNRTDCGFLRGEPKIVRLFAGIINPKRKITGSEFSGVIEQVGSNVTNFKKGDKVFGFNDEGTCAHAEYLVSNASAPLMKMPKNFSFLEAGCCMEGAHYALSFLNKVTVKKNTPVLINGATGAIGSAAVQFAAIKGAKITAVCAGKHHKIIRSLGAQRCIDYQKEDYINDSESYDVIIDTVGNFSFGACKRILNKGGVYLSSELGPGAQNIYLPLLTRFSQKRVVFPFPIGILKHLGIIKKYAEAKKFKPLIDRTYPLKEVAKAFTYVEKGQKTGNVAILVDFKHPKKQKL